ncbi:substrate-binding domain-containing protein [Levilactobacillus brevis]|nr:substrate-binding domain-containing protein [Levilactobacillus brevis]
MNKGSKLAMGIAAISLLLVGCGKATSSTSSKSSSAALSGKVTAVGSTALQPLAAKAGSNFMTKNGKVNLTVQGGGSGTGLSQVQSGAVSIGNSDIFAEEKDGIKADKLTDHKVAVVGMAPVVNKDTGVKNLKMAQLKQIFMGKITNWKEVGGKNQKIVIINRAQGSGTRNGAVQKIVATTPGAISYLAFSYFTNKLQAVSIDNVTPTDNNVETNKWKVWSYEHMYTKGTPDKATAAFLSYMNSKTVQNGLVKDMGYISIHDMKVTKNAKGVVTQN